jgi:hypothetical protein
MKTIDCGGKSNPFGGRKFQIKKLKEGNSKEGNSKFQMGVGIEISEIN